VNYYEHHIGDWVKDTAHLSMIEDGAYRRLMDAYYTREAPLPESKRECCRLVRAVTKAERVAVESILDEFFDLKADGWHQKRCDEEIARFHESEPDRAANREAAKERQRRARARRKSLFEELRTHGVTPEFNATTSELEAMLSQATKRDGKRDVTQPVTRDDTITHSPLPNTQYPNTLVSSAVTQPKGGSDPEAAPLSSEKHVTLAVELRKAGVAVTAMHPMVHEWAKAGVSLEQALEAVALARMRKPDGAIAPNYLAPIVEETLHPKAKPEQWWTSDAKIDAKARELGMQAKPHESYPEFKDRIFGEIAKRRREAA
jgi:uncharacterized protein YdaU (DUF1376 family)